MMRGGISRALEKLDLIMALTFGRRGGGLNRRANRQRLFFLGRRILRCNRRLVLITLLDRRLVVVVSGALSG